MPNVIGLDTLKALNGHWSLWGRSQVGKSTFAEAWAFALIKEGRVGVTFADSHGTARNLAERVANPANGCQNARVEYLNCNSTTHAFGLDPLFIHNRIALSRDQLRAAAHEAALLCASGIASTYGSKMAETPQLETNLYALGFFAALKGLSLLELLPAISLGGHAIREFLLSDTQDYPAAAVLADLHTLAERSPGRFFEQINSLKNRLVRWTNDRRLIRLLGHPKPLDATVVMDERINVCVDTSGLPEPDADYVHTLLQCTCFAGAKRRLPHACAPHRIFIDEAHGSFCDASARMLDQVRKFKLDGTYIFHRITQLIEKGEFIAGAVMTHTDKAIFQVKDAEDAERLAVDVYTGHLDLAEWKAKTERPTPVGQVKIVLRNAARQQSEAESIADGRSFTSSSARAVAGGTARMRSQGENAATSDSLSFVSLPPEPLFGSAPAISRSAGHVSARSASSAQGSASHRSWSQQSAEAIATSTVRGMTRGTSLSEGESEALATVFESLPTALYSLEEQVHRATASIMTLAPRHVILKSDTAPPVLSRMADVPAAWKSAAFRALWWPRYQALLAARSRLLLPVADVDAAIAARLDRIAELDLPDGNFAAPEPAPLLEALERAQRSFSRSPSPADEPPPRGRRRLRIVGKGGDNP